ncbi:NAD(P)-dependent dehydrogenase (short-subunit alcohol dehydrogenase family) [Tahibacter aquaticus]|uniref:NAD(P)-dependent dehydrogenase (Short-subunit alcohol dehydrogenase family) n=1 Tax=Tahibacter aquaticus TaxID=520092 RepID=A0A4R6Z0C6_9GAMM|nr:SDR family oxidoreductase [Tahibacter aquaticus]TDR44965.1 NAD(P)-dependent dehydrogenase (short-subunit alcohol dehydrogenase family) [Tahibacter aquaticus]
MPRKKAPTATAAAATVERQRRIQQAVDGKEQKSASPGAKRKEKPIGAMQAGPREQPQNPLPQQHLKKPGNEFELDPLPRFLAPHYVGSGKLEDMVAIVTGGDSGIGCAVAVLFAREGADVAVLHLDEPEDAEVTRKNIEAEGRRCLVIAGDVRDVEFCRSAVARTVQEFGRLDVLVNNAAFQQHCSRLEDLSELHLQETLQTNIAGYFHMARAALPHLGEGACIINTGSETGLFGSKELLDYSATKGAIHAFTLALASNLQSRGIRVNAVAPGPVWTPLNPADRNGEDVANFGKDSAMGRPAQPEELSPAYVFLASPVCSSYISGAILPVMGGPRG